jgi:type II secretory pathway pseudopilin PulG
MHATRRTCGFTLIELFLSLALTGLLMAAVAASFHATFTSYSQNRKIATAAKAARFTLHQIMREVRRAEAVDAHTDYVSIIPLADGRGLDEIRYEYDDANQSLQRKDVSGGGTQTYTMLGGGDLAVTSFYASSQIGQDWQGTDCTKSVTVYLQIRIDGQTHTVTASGAPRRNQIY